MSRLSSLFRRSIDSKVEDTDNYIVTFYGEDYSELINGSIWPSQAVWINMSNVSILPLIDVFSLYKAIPMSVVYLLIFVTGMFGNACTCVVIARNKHMHTATNFYLFSLAMSDLLLLILGLPQEIYQEWNKTSIIFGESFCVLRGMAAETSTNASILTITAFTVERYLAICHPLNAHTMSKLSRAIKLIWGIWLTSALFAIPTAIQFGVVEQFYRGGETTLQCLVKNELEHTFEVSTFLFFCLPMAIISALYMLIAFRLRRSSLRHIAGSKKTENSSPESRVCRSPGNCRTQNGGAGSRRAVIKMLVAVVVAFFVCWAPFHAQRLMAIYAPNQDPYDVIYEALTYVSGVLYYVSATVNPILYHIMSHKFRSAFKDTLGGCCKRTRTRRRSSSLNNYHKNNSVYNYHSTVRSRVGTENTETTLETLLRDELECPGTGVTGTTVVSSDDKSTLNGQSAAKSRTNHRHHHRQHTKTANGSSKSSSNLYKNNLISKSGSSSFSSSSVSSSLNSESNKNSVGGVPPLPPPPPPPLEVTLPILDSDDNVNKDELVIEMEEFLKMNPSIPIKSDGGNGNYVSRC